MSGTEKKTVGVKVTPTIPQDVYEKLEKDAQLNGMKAATRIGQIVSLFYHGKLAMVDLPGVQNIVVSTTAPTTDAQTTPTGDEKQEQDEKEDEDKKQVSADENEIQALNKSGKKSRRI